MTTTLIAALVVGLLAPFVRGLAWGVPFGLLSISTVLVSFVGSLLTVLLVGALASVALRAGGMSPERADWVAGAVGASVGLGLMLSSARRMRHVRGLSVLCQRLAETDAAPAALEALDRLLDRVQAKDPQRYVALVLMATGPLTQRSQWAFARDRLASLDEEGLSDSQSVLKNQALATCLLQFDDVEGAQAAIDRVDRPTEPSIEVWLQAMEALLLAVRGNPDAAEALLGAQDTSNNPSLDASHRLVRAHVRAARGDDDAALEELKALRQSAGRAGLERVLHPEGPASPLAAELLENPP